MLYFGVILMSINEYVNGRYILFGEFMNLCYFYIGGFLGYVIVLFVINRYV